MKRTLRNVGLAVALGAVPAVVADGGSPVSALGTCSSGTWGSIHGWGDCQAGGGNQHWQLHMSCTWGGSAQSGVITGAGHVDITCNIGSARSVWITQWA